MKGNIRKGLNWSNRAASRKFPNSMMDDIQGVDMGN